MKGLQRGVYLLPNLFTTANLFFGFFALIKAIEVTVNGSYNYRSCAIFVFLAALFDMVDGRVARSTNSASKFGVEYDSLADLLSFGLAPAIILYLWGLQGLGRFGMVGIFLYVSCAALRLARYNIQVQTVEKKYFQGLPVPMAAMMMVGSILIWDGKSVTDNPYLSHLNSQVIMLILTYLLAFLMVSSFPYRSFKSFELSQQQPFHYLLFVVLVIMLFAFRPWWTVYLIGCIYIMSGPVEGFILGPFQQQRLKRKHAQALLAKAADNDHEPKT